MNIKVTAFTESKKFYYTSQRDRWYSPTVLLSPFSINPPMQHSEQHKTSAMALNSNVVSILNEQRIRHLWHFGSA